MFKLIKLIVRLIGWMVQHIIATIILLIVIVTACILGMRLTPLDEFYRARLYAKAGDYAQAEYWYERGLKSHPNSRWAPQAHYELGVLLLKQKRYKKAIGHLGKSLEQLTGDAKKDALLCVAECYAGLQRWKLAARRYALVAVSYPQDEMLAAKALYHAAKCYEKAGMEGEAGKSYRMVFSNYPTSPYAPKALLAYGRILEAKKARERALKQYELLIRRYPDSDEAITARLRIAQIHQAQKRYRDALSMWMELVKLAPRIARSALARQVTALARRQIAHLKEMLHASGSNAKHVTE